MNSILEKEVICMSNFSDFDLDLRANDDDSVEPSGISLTADGFCDTDVITSLVNCTRNTQYQTCLCSTCCGGYTVPVGCSLGC